MSTQTTTMTKAMAAETVNKTTATSDEQIKDTLEHWDNQATGQRLYVARISHETTAGGLIIPEQWREQQNDGVVISAGPIAYINDDFSASEADRKQMSPDELDCATRRFLKPGDLITFGKWDGDTVTRKQTVQKGLTTLMVMNADSVVGVPRKKE